MLSYRPCRHKSYRIGKEELPSLTSALNWRRVLIGMGKVVHQGDRNAEALSNPLARCSQGRQGCLVCQV